MEAIQVESLEPKPSSPPLNRYALFAALLASTNSILLGYGKFASMFSQLFGCFLQCSNSATKGNKSEAKTYEIFKLLHFYGIEGKLRGKPEAELKKLVA